MEQDKQKIASGKPDQATSCGPYPAPDWSALYITVEVYGGSDIREAVYQMQALAQRIGISVWADFNGSRVLARPNDVPSMILADWYKAQAERRDHVSAKY